METSKNKEDEIRCKEANWKAMKLVKIAVWEVIKIDMTDNEKAIYKVAEEMHKKLELKI